MHPYYCFMPFLYSSDFEKNPYKISSPFLIMADTIYGRQSHFSLFVLSGNWIISSKKSRIIADIGSHESW